MLKNIVLAIIVVLLAIFVTVGTERHLKNNRGDFFILEQGAPVPNFRFETIEGKTYQFSDFIDRRGIIHFWASWCAPCVVEFPDLVSLAQNNPESVIIAISSDRTIDAINRFLSKYAPELPDNFLVIHDVGADITKMKFSVFQLPESFIVDKGGVLENHVIGASKEWDNLFNNK